MVVGIGGWFRGLGGKQVREREREGDSARARRWFRASAPAAAANSPLPCSRRTRTERESPSPRPAGACARPRLWRTPETRREALGFVARARAKKKRVKTGGGRVFSSSLPSLFLFVVRDVQVSARRDWFVMMFCVLERAEDVVLLRLMLARRLPEGSINHCPKALLSLSLSRLLPLPMAAPPDPPSPLLPQHS